MSIAAFPCQCGRSFPTAAALRSHLKDRHRNAPGYPAPLCPYCPAASVFLPNSTAIHGRDYGPLWACLPCRAWVGVHPGSCRPLGRLADGELRAEKSRAHAAFDPLWKSGHMPRADAYAWLADQLGIDRVDCHIGMFDVDQCQRVIIVSDWWRERTAA